jgi:Uma2 family endonuclease
MTTATSTKITYDDLLKMPEDNRLREIIDGELIVSPSPSFHHQDIIGAFYRVISDYLDEHPVGRVGFAPLDTVLAADQVPQPDLVYIGKQGGSVIERVVKGAPDLAVEVISETSRRRDEVRKREIYEQFGVTEYWLVDPEADKVTVYRLSDGRYDAGTIVRTLLTTPLLPGLEIDLARVFVQR